MVVAGSEESLPDRLINPEEYEEDLTDPVAVQVESYICLVPTAGIEVPPVIYTSLDPILCQSACVYFFYFCT